MAQETQAVTEQPNPMGDPTMQPVMVSGDFTMGGIFLIWAGMLCFAFLLVRRVKQGAFRIADEGEKSFMKVPDFNTTDKALSFFGTATFIVGFVLVIMDLM